MAANRDELVQQLFMEAVELPPARRAAFLDAECDDPAIRGEVDTLLAHESDVPEDFLSGVPAVTESDGGAGAATQPMVALAAGAMVDDVMPGHTGRYRIVAKLGEGGFGVVYEAEQEAPLRRRVALKIIKVGMDTAQVITRFEAERQALALMDHPNIARVFDAGATNTGRPYFVMELVRGEPITSYCDRHELPLRRRLELFRDVCQAVEHAHQKGVIHRDLKPSNVLVSHGATKPRSHEGTGAGIATPSVAPWLRGSVASSASPKIIDFGIAKATAGRLTDRTLVTEAHQLIGTPQYMSPEQADSSGANIDTRSDIYALGVILYELLTGSTPLEGRRLRSASLAEVQRIICEEEPPKPSTRAAEATEPRSHEATEGASPMNSTPSWLRGSVASSLVRELRGDLDWIAMKCLEKDRNRRYAAASALGDDVQRYLDNQPVLATPPSTRYRIEKFVRRHRGSVIAGAAVAAALLVATALSLSFAVSEARQRQAAEIARARAEQAEADAKARADELEQVAVFQEKQLSGIDPQAMGKRLRTGLLERARAASERSSLTPEQTNARVDELEKLIAECDFTGMALDALLDNFFRPALAVVEKEFSTQPQVEARLLQTLADTLRHLGLLDGAREAQEKALKICRSALGDDHPQTLASINNTGLVLQAQGELAQAEAYLREGLERHRRVLGDEDPATLTAINNVGFVLDAQGRLSEAEPYYREALEKQRRIKGDAHPDTLISINNMGFLLQAQGKLAEAEPYYREALEESRRVLGDGHPDTLSTISNLGVLLQAQGKLSEAETLGREAVENARRVQGDQHPDTLRFINNLGVVLRIQGKLAEAEPYCREALEGFRGALGEDHPDTLTLTNNMGLLLLGQGKAAQAEPYCREALERRLRLWGPDHAETLVSIGSMGGVLLALGKPEQAIAIQAPAEPAARRAFTHSNALKLGRFLTALGRARAATGDFNAAETDLTEAEAIIDGAQGATARDQTDAMTGLVELYGRWHTAEPGKGHDLKAAEWGDRMGKEAAAR